MNGEGEKLAKTYPSMPAPEPAPTVQTTPSRPPGASGVYPTMPGAKPAEETPAPDARLASLYPSMSPTAAAVAAPVSEAPKPVAATEPTEATTAPTEATTAPTEATTAPTKTEASAQESVASELGIFTGFQAPEGMSIDVDAAKALAPVLSELGFKSDDAGRLGQLHARLEAYRVERDDAQARRWEDDARRHPELASDFDGSVRAAQGVLDRFGEDLDDLREQFNRTPLGSHPQMVLLFARVARALEQKGR